MLYLLPARFIIYNTYYIYCLLIVLHWGWTVEGCIAQQYHLKKYKSTQAQDFQRDHLPEAVAVDSVCLLHVQPMAEEQLGLEVVEGLEVELEEQLLLGGLAPLNLQHLVLLHGGRAEPVLRRDGNITFVLASIVINCCALLWVIIAPKFESFENTLEETVTQPEDSWPRWSLAGPVGDRSFQWVVPVKNILEKQQIYWQIKKTNMINKRWDRVKPWSLAQLQTMGVLHLWAGRKKKFWWFLKQSSGYFHCF